MMTKLIYLTKRSFKNSILLSYCVFSFLAKSQANMVNTLTTEEFTELHQCDKKFEYDIYFLDRKVGYLHRTIKWDENTQNASATVTSYGEVTFLWLDSTYQQESTMMFSPHYKHFLTPSFSQSITGIKAREMQADISKNGLKSTVTLNTEVSNYLQKDENKNNTLYDLDTLGAQIRLNLLQGKTRFTLFRQASKKIKRYQFEVAGPEIINHKKWGNLTAIKVIEVGKYKGTALWFSAKHDHQLIKAELDMIFSPVVWLSHFSKECD
jgi:hypothetical protein